MAGSSPLARGTLSVSRSIAALPRFIPARAGNTAFRGMEDALVTVHPRSRGEHPSHTLWTATVDGSSPLARGTLPVLLAGHDARRFIPARAGNTSPGGGGGSSRAVHPRSRGEHDPRGPRAARPDGSSPLARGTLDAERPALVAHRFIPARAGNTGPGGRAPCSRSVHPRSRGEHCLSPAARLADAGSSPLARGTRVRRNPEPPMYRFIPARAGNTPPPSP